MKQADENLGISMVVGAIISISLIATFGFGYTLGKDSGYQSGREVSLAREKIYVSVACGYAKDAGRALPEWCRKEEK